MEVQEKIRKGRRYRPSPFSQPSVIVAHLERTDALFDKNEIDWKNIPYFIKQSINMEGMDELTKLTINAAFDSDINSN